MFSLCHPGLLCGSCSLGAWDQQSRSAWVTLINSLIVSRLDYCNSLLTGCNKQLVYKLQRVLNCAARVIFGGDRREHITPLLRDKLHWLRARERITFKLCLLVYKARNSMIPNYIQDLCVPVSTVSTRSALCSARVDLVVSHTRRRLRNWAFSIAGPATWSSLPPTFVMHQHCVLSKICSRLVYFRIRFNHQLNFE